VGGAAAHDQQGAVAGSGAAAVAEPVAARVRYTATTFDRVDVS
jgi:hypothetical protein